MYTQISLNVKQCLYERINVYKSKTHICACLYIKNIYIHHDNHQVMLIVRISIVIHLYHPSLLAGFLGCILCPHRTDESKFYWSAGSCARVQKKFSLMSSPLFCQKDLTYLMCFT